MWGRGRALESLEREIQEHIEQETRDNLDRGLPPREARRQALLKFGNIGLVKEDARAVWTWGWLERRLLDARCASRTLARTPGLSAVALVCLGVAIGLTTAAFSVIHGAFLSPLPVPNGDRLVVVQEYHRSGRYHVPLTPAQVSSRQERSRSFDALGVWYSRNVTLAGPGAGEAAPTLVRAEYVSPNALGIVGVAPALGRHPREDDATSEVNPVVVLGDAVWRSRLGSDPHVLDRAVSIDGRPHRVIGVMPPGFAFPMRGDLWIPIRVNAAAGSGHHGLTLFGRLKEGVSAREAAAELALLAALDEGRDEKDATVPIVMPFARGFMSPEHEWAIVGFLLGLMFFVVIIAANLANLFFARNALRTREIALRAALGASRGRLIAQLLMESLLLATGGALVGLAVSRVGVAWFQSRVEDVPWWADFGLDVTVLAVVIATSLVSSAVAGVGPALRLTHAADLKDGGIASTSLRFSRLGAALIVVQIAVSVGFLGVVGVLANGLFGFSYQAYSIRRTDVLVAQVYLGGPSPSELSRPGAERREVWRRHFERSLQQFERMGRRIGELPGVSRVTWSTHFPGNDVETVRIDVPVADAETRTVSTRIAEVGPDFFETLDVRPVQGRDFGPADRIGPAHSVIVNLPFARKYFPAQNPLGSRLRLSAEPGSPSRPWLEVVGVVPDLGLNPGDRGRADGIYIPFQPSSFARFAVRSGNLTADLVPRIHEILIHENANVQLQSVQTLDAQMNSAEAVFGGLAAGLSLIGGTALLLSAVSFYSLVSFSVTRRTREIGIRLALGASRGRILRCVLGRELFVILSGAAAGVALGTGLYRLVDLIPFDLSPAGPSLLAVVATVMLFVGAGACVRPLCRAISIQPVEALRED